MKVINYEIKIKDTYISCDDVPSRVCSEVACSECPFCHEDISLEDVIIGYMEKYNADN